MRINAEQMRVTRANRQRRYDEAIKPILEELMGYGFGYNAIARAMNTRAVPSPNGGKNTGKSVRRTMERIGLEH